MMDFGCSRGRVSLERGGMGGSRKAHHHAASISRLSNFLRVPSHTAIPGNERADALAEEGRVSSPLYQVLSLPERNVISLELPSTLPPPPEGTSSSQVVRYITSVDKTG